MSGKDNNAFILLGGLESSVNPEFIHALEERNFAVLVIDRPINRKGDTNFINSAIPEALVAEIFCVEPDNYREVMQKVLAWAEVYNLAGVLNTTEEYLLCGAHIADYLSLPGPGMFASLVSSDKSIQRTYFNEYSPATYSMSLASLPADMRFPLLLKPVGRHGGSGLLIINDADELEQQVSSQSSEVFILEEYIEGRDFSIETLVQNGQVVYENITEEYSLAPPLGHLEMGYSIPAETIDEDTIAKAYAINRKIVSALKVQAGICHIEYRVDRKDDVYLIEIAARPPGDSLLNMYGLAVGEPIERQILNCLLGEAVVYPRPNRLVRQKYFVHEKGVFLSIDGLPNYAKPNVYHITRTRYRLGKLETKPAVGIDEVILNYATGDHLSPLSDASTRVGSCIYSADDADSMAELESRWVNNISIAQTGRNMHSV